MLPTLVLRPRSAPVRDEAGFEEGKHPRAKNGEFARVKGGGGAASRSPTEKTGAQRAFLRQHSVTGEHVIAATGPSRRFRPGMTVSQYVESLGGDRQTALRRLQREHRVGNIRFDPPSDAAASGRTAPGSRPEAAAPSSPASAARAALSAPSGEAATKPPRPAQEVLTRNINRALVRSHINANMPLSVSLRRHAEALEHLNANPDLVVPRSMPEAEAMGGAVRQAFRQARNLSRAYGGSTTAQNTAAGMIGVILAHRETQQAAAREAAHRARREEEQRRREESERAQSADLLEEERRDVAETPKRVGEQSGMTFRPTTSDDLSAPGVEAYASGVTRRIAMAKHWRAVLPVPPKELVHHIFGGDPGGTISVDVGDSSLALGGGATASFTLRNKDMRLTRTFRREPDGSLAVHHDYLVMNSATQGKNLGKRMFRNMFTAYDDMGVSKVDLLANCDVGGYAWAKYGFQPTRRAWDEVRGVARSRLNRPGEDVAPEVEAEVRAILDDDDPRAIWRLSDTRIGKKLLLGQNWSAEMNLKDPLARERLKCYVDKAD